MSNQRLIFTTVLFWASVLGLDAADLSVNGQVRDAVTRAPVGQVQVTIVGNAARSPATTDDKGVFVISLHDQSFGDTVRLRMQKENYAVFDELITISKISLNLELTPKKRGGPLVLPLDQRPWVSVTAPPKLEVVVGRPIIAGVPLQNTGKTPALNMRTQVFIRTFSNNTSTKEIEATLARERDTRPFILDGDLPPAVSRITEVHSLEPLTEPQRISVHTGAVLLFLSEMLKYEDIYGNSHTTRACFHVISAPTDPEELKGLFAFCSSGNAMN